MYKFQLPHNMVISS